MHVSVEAADPARTLTEWGYRNVCVNLSRMGYRSTEPKGIPRESSQLLGKVVRAMVSEGKKPAHIAADLQITLDELNSHMFELAPTAVDGGSQISTPNRPNLTVYTNR